MLKATQIQKLVHTAQREWARSARDLGLTQSEFGYLSAIYDQEKLQRYEDHHGQHLQDIVDSLGVSKASASTMFAKLEARGLVERFQCIMDARAQHIVLTGAGRKKHQLGLELYDRVARIAQQDPLITDV